MIVLQASYLKKISLMVDPLPLAYGRNPHRAGGTMRRCYLITTGASWAVLEASYNLEHQPAPLCRDPKDSLLRDPKDFLLRDPWVPPRDPWDDQ